MNDPSLPHARALLELNDAEYEQNEASEPAASLRLLAVAFLVSGAVICAIIWSAVA